MKAILIGGTSHAGKSTLARYLSEVLGWKTVSTDSLARHPGRPWKTLPETVPPPVADHYLSLSIDELLADVLRHYRGLWPTISDLTARSETPLVVEGSALWPQWAATLASPNVAAVWLTASDDFLRQRIYAASGFENTDDRQEIIRKFVGRTLLYNQQMMEVVHRVGLPSMNVENRSVEELGEQYLTLLKAQ